MRLIEESDDEDVVTTISNKRSSKKSNKTVNDKESNEDEEVDDINDLDYNVENLSETSSIEYLTEEEDDDEQAVGKKRFKRTCMDDGDEELFLKRYKQLEKSEKLKQQELDEEEDEDELLEMVEDDDLDAENNDKEKNKIVRMNNHKHIELDAGLQVPENIWNRLYKFQKTGLKWLWELHLQRCGGILGDVRLNTLKIDIFPFFTKKK